VTSKLQVTVPKDIADQFSIQPGDEIDWIPAGDGIRVIKRAKAEIAAADVQQARLQLFDEATQRQARRNQEAGKLPGPSGERGWTREELYRRGRSG
jgi:bifunctional DNA-binding transcriptional regulator/antitoxin component of YhaV-PrlF toxin-antitoxin module